MRGNIRGEFGLHQYQMFAFKNKSLYFFFFLYYYYYYYYTFTSA